MNEGPEDSTELEEDDGTVGCYPPHPPHETTEPATSPSLSIVAAKPDGRVLTVSDDIGEREYVDWDGTGEVPPRTLPDGTSLVYDKFNSLPVRDTGGALPLGSVYNQCKWVAGTDNTWDLFVFGIAGGKCRDCCSDQLRFAGTTQYGHGGGGKVVYRLNGMPYVAVGARMRCCEKECGASFSTLDHDYVASLPPYLRRKMPFLSSGQTRGIDYSMIIPLRLGQDGEAVSRMSFASITKLYHTLQSNYRNTAMNSTRNIHPGLKTARFSSWAAFRPIDDGPVRPWAAGYLLRQAFIMDYEYCKTALFRELLSVGCHQSIKVDHQRQIVARARTPKKDKKSTLTDTDGSIMAASIVNDEGMICNWVVTPTTSDVWLEDALKEVISRTDKPPIVQWVDTGCCGSKSRPYKTKDDWKKYGLTCANACRVVKKCLDGLHLCLRVTRAMNSSHPRKALFHRKLFASLYIDDEEDVKALAEVQTLYERLRNKKLTRKQKRDDRERFVRKVIDRDGKAVAERWERLIAAFEKFDLKFAEAKRRDDASKKKGDGERQSFKVNSAHWACPLITPKIRKIMDDGIIHLRNGCHAVPDDYVTHIARKEIQYRKEPFLPKLTEYESTSGTSANETYHSSIARAQGNSFGIRYQLQNARSAWHTVHYNRHKLTRQGKETIPDGLTYLDVGTVEVLPLQPDEKFLFGWDYYVDILEKRGAEVRRRALNEIREEHEQILNEIRKEQETARKMTSEESDLTINDEEGISDSEDFVDGNEDPATGKEDTDTPPDSLQAAFKKFAADMELFEPTVRQERHSFTNHRPESGMAPTRRSVGKRRSQAASRDLVSPSFNKDTAAAFLEEYVAVAGTVGGGSWTESKMNEVFMRYSKKVYANDKKIDDEDNDELRRVLHKLYHIDIGSAISYVKSLQKRSLAVVKNCLLNGNTDEVLRDLYESAQPEIQPKGVVCKTGDSRIDSHSKTKKLKKHNTAVEVAPLNGQNPFENNYVHGYLGGVEHRIELAKAKRAELIRLLAKGSTVPHYMAPTTRLVMDGTPRWVCGICGDNVQRPTSNKTHKYLRAHEGHIMYKKGSKVLYCCYSDAEETAANFEANIRRVNLESKRKQRSRKPAHPALTKDGVAPQPNIARTTTVTYQTASYDCGR